MVCRVLGMQAINQNNVGPIRKVNTIPPQNDRFVDRGFGVFLVLVGLYRVYREREHDLAQCLVSL